MQLKDILNNKNNVNVNNIKKNNVNNVTATKDLSTVRQIASDLCEKLGDSKSYLFFCKIAWQLPECQIWANLEIAQRGRNPRAYFTYLCKLSINEAKNSVRANTN